MKFEHRYDENAYTISLEEAGKLKDSTVCVVGCGSVGAYAVEMLARLGVGSIVIADGGVFKETDLNRQIYCDETNIGTSKVQRVRERIGRVNSEVHVVPVEEYISDENARDIIAGADVVIEALNNMATRKMLSNACYQEGVPMIHGAMAGWYAQVATIYPGDKPLEKIYPAQDQGSEHEFGNPAFTPALIASLEVIEAVKVMLHKGVSLKSKMLSIDLLLHEYEVFGV